jgi:hypothetical protein
MSHSEFNQCKEVRWSYSPFASVLIGKSVTFWAVFQGGGKWGRVELLRSNSTML